MCQCETPRLQTKSSIIKSYLSIGQNSTPPNSPPLSLPLLETLSFDSTAFRNRFNTSAQVSGQHRCSRCANIPHPSEGRADLLSVRERGKHSQSRHLGTQQELMDTHPSASRSYTHLHAGPLDDRDFVVSGRVVSYFRINNLSFAIRWRSDHTVRYSVSLTGSSPELSGDPGEITAATTDINRWL